MFVSKFVDIKYKYGDETITFNVEHIDYIQDFVSPVKDEHRCNVYFAGGSVVTLDITRAALIREIRSLKG